MLAGLLNFSFQKVRISLQKPFQPQLPNALQLLDWFYHDHIHYWLNCHKCCENIGWCIQSHNSTKECLKYNTKKRDIFHEFFGLEFFLNFLTHYSVYVPGMVFFLFKTEWIEEGGSSSKSLFFNVKSIFPASDTKVSKRS